ncbi:MAG: 50S ribosomal protein L29 [Parcubacteria group bacterium]|nr:50S ribosomal protein L29 [Parcubacteria group bacterium]
MKYKEFRELSSEELKRRLQNKREALRYMGFRVHAHEWKEVRKIREVKKDIAKILTLLHKKS